MKEFGKIFLVFLKDTSGATAIEYGLLAGLMAVASIAAFTQLGVGVQNLFNAGASETMDEAIARF
jgi:pilus assembly protein Flp/PilA